MNNIECLDYSEYGECMLYTIKNTDKVPAIFNLFGLFIINTFLFSGFMMLTLTIFSSALILCKYTVKLYKNIVGCILNGIAKMKHLYVILNNIDTIDDKKNINRFLTIIRGMPGSGKKHLAYYLENNNCENVVMCSNNDFFYKNNHYSFNSKKIGEAIHACKKKAIKAMSASAEDIYVMGNFNEKWLYEEYVLLAESFGYSVKIIDISCSNIDELRYFNTRCIHTIPFKKSLSLYKSWEFDERSEYFTPYIRDYARKLNLKSTVESNTNWMYIDEIEELN